MNNTGRSYFVFGIQRSGSTLLCESLRACKVAGTPQEWFYNAWMGGYETFAKAPPPPHDISTEQGLRESCERILRGGSTKNGVFGAKVMWNYWPRIVSTLRRLPELAEISDDLEVAQTALPGLKLIRISRRDRVAQAVSWAKGEQSRQFSSIQKAANTDLRYDFDQLATHYRHIEQGENGWDEFFESRGIQPLHVYYEDMVADFEKTMRETLKHIGCSEDFDGPFKMPLARQANALNLEWAERFRKDMPKRLARR